MTTKDKAARSNKVIVSHKKAFHEYTILETFKAGIVLTGTEIKSIRNGKVSMNDSHARIERNEVFLYGLQITPYDKGGFVNHDPNRTRKLLLSRREIDKLIGKLKESGLTLVPLRMYFDRCWVKIDLALAKGKKIHDKRADIIAREGKRTIERAMKSSRRTD